MLVHVCVCVCGGTEGGKGGVLPIAFSVKYNKNYFCFECKAGL